MARHSPGSRSVVECARPRPARPLSRMAANLRTWRQIRNLQNVAKLAFQVELPSFANGSSLADDACSCPQSVGRAMFARLGARRRARRRAAYRCMVPAARPIGGYIGGRLVPRSGSVDVSQWEWGAIRVRVDVFFGIGIDVWPFPVIVPVVLNVVH